MASLTGHKRRRPDEAGGIVGITKDQLVAKPMATQSGRSTGRKPDEDKSATKTLDVSSSGRKATKASSSSADAAVGGAGAVGAKKLRPSVLDDDIDELFSGLRTAKVKAAETAAADEAKAAAKARKAAKAEAAAKAALEELERKGRSSNRIKGADSPVPIRYVPHPFCFFGHLIMFATSSSCSCLCFFRVIVLFFTYLRVASAFTSTAEWIPRQDSPSILLSSLRWGAEVTRPCALLIVTAVSDSIQA